MTLKTMDKFTFNHSDQQDALYSVYTANQIKALFDSRGEELRIALNLLITALLSTEGASNIGTSSIQDVDGVNVQEMLKSVRDKLKSKADGSSGADYVNATAIQGLAGETVQAILKSLKTYVDNTKEGLNTSINSVKDDLTTSINGIKASNINADPIAIGSGTTVQAQLAWLLSQIAIAATGSIPDGSLTEAKLAQAVVDKINKSLSNIGVMTTLQTIDKSSLVNALNEHMADYVSHPANGGTSAGTSTAYTCNSSPNPTNLVDKMGIVITAHVDSGANPTIKWGSLAAKSIKKPNGNAANLKKDGLYTLRYNSVNDSFILQGEGGEYGDALAKDVRSTKTFGTENGVQQGTLDLSNVIPSNIRNGIVIDGVVGNLKSVFASDSILVSDTLTNLSASTTPTKFGKRFTAKFDGSIRYKIPLRNNNTGRINYVQVYRNGSPYGSIMQVTDNTFVTYTQDYSCNYNDYFDIYIWLGTDNTIFAQPVQICADVFTLI